MLSLVMVAGMVVAQTGTEICRSGLLRGPSFRPEGRNPIGSFMEGVPIPRAVQDRYRRDVDGAKPASPTSPSSAPRPRR